MPLDSSAAAELELGTIARTIRSSVFRSTIVKFKQFAALPYRVHDAGLEVLLITTRKKRRWSVPKGWPIERSSPQQTAATEAYEEAGVLGPIGMKHIGRFKKRRLKKKQSVLCEVQIFPLQVERQQGDWPEKRERNRLWVAPRAAAKLVKKPGLRRAIKNFEPRQMNNRVEIPGQQAT
jgi:8-oxo-dGTP pyrophosphatase MutT (NUDIX family)